jgi:hypothetical protein
MATEQGILQALWGEVRPAVEARSEDFVRRCVALVNRHKTGEALTRFAETLAQPTTREAEVLAGISRRALGGCLAPDAGSPEARARLWQELTHRAPERWTTCRLFLDDPLPDRVWLFRRGVWVFYRWDGDRFAGFSLPQVREGVAAGRLSAVETMLELRVGGLTFANPKIQREGDA